MVLPRRIAVYCGASSGHDPRHRADAARFGRILAEAGIGLVYGGGHVGLMGALADAVIDHGGEVTGVIPPFLVRAEDANSRVTNLEIVPSMHVRKQRMFDLADAFVVLPGGLGTLDETIEMVTWRQIGLHDKPVLIVGSESYWQPLYALVEHVVVHGFAPERVRAFFVRAPTVDDVLPTLLAQPAPTLPSRPERA